MDPTVHDHTYTSPQVVSCLSQTKLVPGLTPCLRSTPYSPHPPPIEDEVSEMVFFRFPTNITHEFQSYPQSSVFPTQVTVLHVITLWLRNINKLWSFFTQYLSSSYLIFFH